VDHHLGPEVGGIGVVEEFAEAGHGAGAAACRERVEVDPEPAIGAA
jgi:hypothetical protein